MITFSRLLSKQASRFFSIKWLTQRDSAVFLPFYHVVSDEKLPHILNYPYRNLKQFEKELDFYLNHFKPVTLEELVAEKHGGGQIFHLSFDDGLRECAEVVAPLLLGKGIPATFFINTAFIDNRNLFHKYKASLILGQLRENPNTKAVKLLAKNNLSGKNILKAEYSQTNVLNEAAIICGIDFNEFLKNKKPYLTTGQIKKMHNDGFSIGAHSHNHPEFWKITVEDQILEVRESMAMVEEIVNPAVKTFSFPFSDSGVPAVVLQTIFDENICDVTFGTAGIKKDTFDFHLQRYPAEQPGDFILNLKGEFIYNELRKRTGKSTVKH